MGWKMESVEDLIYFLVSPVTSPFTFAYGAAYYATGRPDDMTEPDWEASARNMGMWAFIAGVSWAYHSWMFPGQFQLMSGAKSFELITKLAPWPAVAFTVVATAPVTLALANKAIIESAPPEQQQSMWQVFAQAISGTGQPGVRHSYGS